MACSISSLSLRDKDANGLQKSHSSSISIAFIAAVCISLSVAAELICRDRKGKSEEDNQTTLQAHGIVVSNLHKRLATLIAERRDEPYGATMGWI